METVAVIFTLVSVILTATKNKFCWITGIIGSILYFLIFWNLKLYGDSLLQIIFIVQSFYGFFSWNGVNLEKFSWMNNKYVVILLTFIIYCLLFIANDIYPLTDTLITIGSIIATYLLAVKDRKSWIIWIIVNLISIILYFKKDLNQTAYLYILFIFIDIYGYLNWKKWKQSILGTV